MYIKVNRRNRPDCIVMLCQDRATEKWCYVNISTEHVCACRFDTIDDAIADMIKREDVVFYSLINNPFAPPKTATAIDHEVPAYDPSVFKVNIEKWMNDLEELDNYLSDLIVKDLRETK